ncbi:GntR family transcriptional regulator [Streptomyces huiliensis]|uniref:GntR family transcriptional regulator n=1 Tax=Streptomyces huiliensis TaxID=2876027 RepID=UPI001CBA7485|nr:GntR family transcriptional regulator [Streptomyces huiliensis]MBZ4321480.1 GntR family transcriptional regulator [Streptomyces huiliensis]
MTLSLRYQQIADELRRGITTGTYKLGERLPSEDALAALLDVGRPTLRDALDVLQAEGLLKKRHGSGTYVTRPQPPVRYAPGARTGQPDAAVHSKIRTTLSVTSIKAGVKLASLLHVPGGTPVAKYRYLNREGEVAHSVAHVHVPQSVADRDLRQIREVRSPWGEDVLRLLLRAGVHVETTAQRLAARLATAEEAKLLEITIRTPVLSIERVSTDAGGRVVEAAHLVLRGERSEAVFTTPALFPDEEAADDGTVDGDAD